MLSLLETLSLDDHEDVVDVFRTDKGPTIRTLCIDVAVIVGLFFFMTPLFRAGPWGVGFFLTILGICVLVGYRTVLIHLGTVCIATTARIIVIERKGFWAKSVRELAYKEIVHAQYTRKGMWGAIRNVGTVQCMLKSSTVPFEIVRIIHPQKLLEIIGRFTTFQEAQESEPRKSHRKGKDEFAHRTIPKPKSDAIPSSDDEEEFWTTIKV